MSDHRPEPFTTIDGFANYGFQCEPDEGSWYKVAPTQRSIVAALHFLDGKGLKKLGLLLNVIPELGAYDYVPVICNAEPLDYARAIEKLDFDKLNRKPVLYFRLDTYNGIPGAFINNG